MGPHQLPGHAPRTLSWRSSHRREIGYRTVDIFRVADGKLVEHWDVVDQLDLLTSIGALVPGHTAET